MDNSYSHLAKHMSQGDVLQDMTAGKPAFPVKPLDKAVVAHMGAARLKTGAEWHQHCAFRGCEISPVVNVDGFAKKTSLLRSDVDAPAMKKRRASFASSYPMHVARSVRKMTPS